MVHTNKKSEMAPARVISITASRLHLHYNSTTTAPAKVDIYKAMLQKSHKKSPSNNSSKRESGYQGL
ncbi:MAG TPA: hypothetical protein VHK91_11015 [Flavisolibacter sp.]|jgi:hypothetical protein|nr:hypothetical protein [Flavisolibacter sp.]